MTVTERFAPSPTGPLHLGHAFSAWTAFDAAHGAEAGRFLLRLEDLDPGRSRPEFAAAIEEDLAWLGLTWERPVLAQSQRAAAYAAALGDLARRGLVYPCFCSRKDIAAALAAPQEGDGRPRGVYPGTCRGLAAAERDARVAAGASHALRLDMAAAIQSLGGGARVSQLGWREIGRGPQGETGPQALDADRLLATVGDETLGRKDAAAAYHLAVIVDDAWQGVTHVTRGEDLFDASALHRLLQALLDLPTPVYRHHRLIRNAAGARLSKRDGATALAALRAAGETPGSLRERLALGPPANGKRGSAP